MSLLSTESYLQPKQTNRITFSDSSKIGHPRSRIHLIDPSGRRILYSISLCVPFEILFFQCCSTRPWSSGWMALIQSIPDSYKLLQDFPQIFSYAGLTYSTCFPVPSVIQKDLRNIFRDLPKPLFTFTKCAFSSFVFGNINKGEDGSDWFLIKGNDTEHIEISRPCRDSLIPDF